MCLSRPSRPNGAKAGSAVDSQVKRVQPVTLGSCRALPGLWQINVAQTFFKAAKNLIYVYVLTFGY